MIPSTLLAIAPWLPMPLSSDPPSLLALPFEVGDFAFDGDVVAFEAREQEVDWNGNGETDDYVIHVLDLSTGVVANLGASAFTWPDQLHVASGRVAFLVREAVQAADWSGDGDTSDRVLAVYHTETGVLENTGITGWDFVAGVKRLVLSSGEAKQAETDLNGDGDTTDRVAFVLDLATDGAVPINTHLATSSERVGGENVVVLVRESSQGQDLNGDGDMLDNVLHFGDDAHLANTALDAGLSSGFFVNELYLFGVFGSSQLLAVHFGTDTILDLGMTFSSGRSVDGFAAITQKEQLEGVDANGDGVLDGTFLRVVETQAYQQKIMPVLLTGSWMLGEGGVAFDVRETDTDLNGNGLLGDDVAHAYVFETEEIFNLKGELEDVDGSIVATMRTEEFVADLNGDGDREDHVVQTFDFATGETFNTGLATVEPSVSGDYRAHVFGDVVAVRSEEKSQGEDFNGDGDKKDHVLHFVLPAAQVVRNTGLVIGDLSSNDLLVSGGRAVVEMSEKHYGVDVTGDGALKHDRILVVLELP